MIMETSHSSILEKSRRWGYVHSVETGAAVDGPGLRYMLFVSGCNFQCLYCHNCDTWTSRPEQKKDVGSVLEDIAKYVPFLRKAGGLTISGGEPLTQPDFVGEIFRQVKRRWNLHTALDTQGSLASQVPDEWFNPVDLVLLDIKHIDSARHRELTGQGNEATLETAQRLNRLGKALWIRYVMVPGWTDAAADAERLADFIKPLTMVQRVEVLPFHQLGAHKWHDLGRPYALETTKPPEPAAVELIRDAFRSRGLTVY